MELVKFKERVAEIKPGRINNPEGQEVIIRIKRGGRRKDHFAKVLYVMGGSLGIGDRKNYTEITCEYIEKDRR